MNDFTIVNLQDLTTATGLTENDFLAIGQGSNALTKTTIRQVGVFLGISSSVVLGDKYVEPTVPSFAFAEPGVYPEWGNIEITGDLGILIFDGTNFYKTEINFIANGLVEEGNTQAVSGGEVFNKTVIPREIGMVKIQENTNSIQELVGSSINDSELWEVGAIWATTGMKVNDETADSLYVRTKKFYKIFPEQIYEGILQLHNNNNGYAFYEIEDESSFVGGGVTGMELFTKETPSSAHFLKFTHRVDRNTDSLKFSNINEIKIINDSVFLPTSLFEEKAKNVISSEIENFGGKVIDKGTNFIQDLVGSSLDDNSIWADGYLNNVGQILPTNDWYSTLNYYFLPKGTYNSLLYLTGNAKMVVYDTNKEIKEILSNPNTSDTYNQDLVFDSDCLVRFSHRQRTGQENRINNIKIVNVEDIYSEFITTENITNFIPPASNNTIRKTLLDTYRSKKKRPIVTIISDDGNPDDLEWFVPILDEFGVKATFALIGSRVRNSDNGINTSISINSEQAHELYLNGHDIASHTWTHTPNWGSVLTLEEIEEEMSRTKLFLEKITFDSVNMFISPWGIRSAEIDNIISKYYDANFISIASGHISVPLDNYYLRRKSFDANETTPSLLWDSVLKPDIDDAILNNRWLVFSIHPAYTQYNSWENKEARKNELRILLQYCKDNNIEVTTAKKAYNYYKNHVDIGVRRVDSRVYQLGMDGTEYNFNYFND